ncbi:hypothetical protein [Curtobacterium flaccumfaciens]|uniref:hypothetical protein n=1 Tax=Curtobacterium flaccumfaciens TaxID=2035 RepID=UPI00160281BE|nr:hypothetical protein [Curtobacterium flaccumfaciens]MBB1195857.1 hypothetical protein [Curtobacterium flaccumfaciens]
MTVQQLVEAALPARVRRWWSTVDVGTAVLDCADRLLPGAVTLPLTVFTGRLVYPVVVFPGDLVRRRLNGHREAIRDLDTLEKLIDAPAGDDPVSPLRIAGFISVDTPRAALPALSGLRTLGRAIHLRPFVDPDAVELRAYELRGITVAAACAGVTVAVPGHSTAAPGSRYDPFWRRVREEELWSLALAAGVLDEVVQR